MTAPRLSTRIDGDRVVVEIDGLAASSGLVDDLVRRPGPLEANAWDRLVASGELPARKLGRTYYARRSDLLALVPASGTGDRARPTRAPATPREALAALAGKARAKR